MKTIVKRVLSLVCALTLLTSSLGDVGMIARALRYSVDFHLGEYTYNLAGGGDIFLSELLRYLGSSEEGRERAAQGELDLLALSDELSRVESVTFSDPGLVQVDKVEIVADQPELIEDDYTEELADQYCTDWRLTSLAPFATEETLTVKLGGGESIEILVTDITYGDDAGETVTHVGGRRVTADGVTYILRGLPDDRDRYADVYALAPNCTIHDEIVSNGVAYPVYDIAQHTHSLTNNRNDMDIDFVIRAAENTSFDLPDIKFQPDVIPQASEGFVPGENNGGKYQFWKKSEYNPETNSIDYTMQYFQSMQKAKLDFIFIYDDSVSMYSGIRYTATGVRLREAQTTRVVILDAVNALLPHGGAAQKEDYDVNVYLGGASSGHNTWDGPFTTYEQVADAMSVYRTGVTNHDIGVNNALEIARKSVAAGRQPVVIYLSDFHQCHTLSKSLYNTTELHRLAPVYGLSTGYRYGHHRADTNIPSGRGYMHMMKDIKGGVEELRDIIYEAIGYYMEDKVAVTDTLSDALQSYTAGAGTTNGGSAPSATGRSVWSIGGTTIDAEDDKLYSEKAGTLYTETFSVPLDDETIFAGSTPTNAEATVTVGGEVVNVITPGSDLDHLRIGEGVTFVLGRMGERNNRVTTGSKGEPADKINGVAFTLTEAEKVGSLYQAKPGAATLTYTTATVDGVDGSFVIPFRDGTGGAVLKLGATYLLAETQESVDAYNVTADPELVMPDAAWVISVADNGVVTASVNGAASQTEEVTKWRGAPPKFVLWNQVVVNATLIPITLKKTWVGDGRRESVPFTIYGVDPDKPYAEHELIAYESADPTSRRVAYIGEGYASFREEGNVWTQTVYVPDKETIDGVEYHYYSDKTLSDYNAHNYHLATGEKANLDGYATGGVITYDQSYSYLIKEGDMVDPDGWYVPEYGNNVSGEKRTNDAEELLTTSELVAYSDGTDTITVENGTLDGEALSASFQFHLVAGEFTYNDYKKGGNNLTASEFHKAFHTTSKPSHSDDAYITKIDEGEELKNFYKELGTVTVEFERTSDSTTRQYSLTFAPNTDSYKDLKNIVATAAHDGFTFRNLSLPESWNNQNNCTVVHRELNTKTDFYALNGITITKISVTSKDYPTKPVILYSNNKDENGNNLDTGNVMKYDPEYDPTTKPKTYGDRPEFELNGTNEKYHGYCTAYTDQSLSILGTAQPLTDTQYNKTDFTIKGAAVLDVTNTWHPNPLVSVKVVKNWKNGETGADYAADTYGVKQDVTFSVTGTTARGGTKKVPIFESDTAAWSKGRETATIALVTDGANANVNSAVWEKTVYVPTYDTSTYDLTASPVCEAYTFDSIIEETDLRDATPRDSDNQPRGTWADATAHTVTGNTSVTGGKAHNVTGDWSTLSDGRFVYLKMTRVNNDRDYRPCTSIKFYYNSDESKNAYESVIYFDADHPIGDIALNASKGKTFYVKIKVPAEEKNDQLWLLESCRQVSGNTAHGQVSLSYDAENNKIKYTYTATSGYYGIIFPNASATMPGFNQVGASNHWTTQPALVFDDVEFVSEAPEGANIVEGASYSIRKYTADTFTITNTFYPNKALTLSSSFHDDSADWASAKDISSVVYTISGTTASGEPYSRTVVDSAPSLSATATAATVTFDKTVYVPMGTYTVTQTAYTLDGGSTQYPTSAFHTTSTFNGGDAQDGNQRTGVSVTDDGTVSFGGERKNLAVTVQMAWEPGLADGEDPLAESGKAIGYALTYMDSKGVEHTASGSDYQLTEARQVNTHSSLPAFGLRGDRTTCLIDRQQADAALPDYYTYADCDDDADRLTYTLTAYIKRSDVIVEKNWGAITGTDDVTLTFTVTRSDGKNITGTNSPTATLTLTKDDAQFGVWLGSVSVGTDIFGEAITLPVLRSVCGEADVKYILTETAQKAGASVSYIPLYSDLTDAAAHGFEQTNPSSETNQARFRLDASGIVIGVTNATVPYVCKIVEDFGGTTVEIPFLSLNDAVEYARNNMTMDAEHPVNIQMLTDYEMPAEDKLTLTDGDHFTISTAPTSGAMYNFVDTQPGKDPADQGTAIITRGFSGDSLFTVGDGGAASLTLGDVVLDGGRDSGLTGGDGALVHVNASGSSLQIGDGAVLRNSASTGSGGAVCAEPGTSVAMSGGTITGCSADNGAAVYLRGSDGSESTFAMSGGTITDCHANGSSGAVAVNGDDTSLIFSGDAQVTGNTAGTDNRSANVYLDVDSNGVINAAGLGDGASIGVYVSDKLVGLHTVFSRHGGAQDSFGTFTDDTNLEKFISDRNGLQGVRKEGTNEIMWQQSLHIEVRFVNDGSLASVPTASNSELLFPGHDIFLSEVPAQIGDLADAFYAKYKDDPEFVHKTNMVFWKAYPQGETDAGAVVEQVRRFKSPETVANIVGSHILGKLVYDQKGLKLTAAEDKTLVLYYYEPVCKLTDENNRLLYTDADAKYPAVYPTLEDGVKAAATNLYRADKSAYRVSDGGIQLKMLRDYEVSVGSTWSAARSLTVISAEPNTTAEAYAYMATNRDTFIFHPTFTEEEGRLSTDGNRAILKRGSGFTGSFLTVSGSAQLTTKYITFDGSNISTNANGGFVSYSGTSAITVKNGTTMRNSIGNQGGAIGTASSCASAHVYIQVAQGEKVLFENCKAASGSKTGGAIRSYDTPVDITNNGTLIFEGCEADSGGAIHIDRTNNLTVTNSADASLVFDGCKAVNGNGGAIYAGANVEIDAESAGGVAFQGCTASSNGGAIYQGGESGKMILTNVSFGGDDADEKCCAGKSAGAVYIKSPTAELTDCDFSYCEADTPKGDDDGGAVAFNGSGTLSVYGCVFDHCKTLNSKTPGQGNGGAIYVGRGSNAGLLVDKSETRRSLFTDCSAARYGGAIEFERDGGTMTVKNTDFIHCGTSDDAKADRRDGGAIGNDAQYLWIENCTFDRCYSARNGGAIACSLDNGTSSPEMTFKNSTITNCTAAKLGGGIYVKNSTGAAAKATIIGDAVSSSAEIKTKITGCSASDPNGGAINVANDDNRVFFEGDVLVYDNTDAGGSQKNMVLDKNSNTVIQTTSAGLGKFAHIGVYTTNANNAYAEHGQEGKTFGTQGQPNQQTLSAFRNDRHPELYGVKRNATDPLIYWAKSIARVSADGGETWTYHPFLFGSESADDENGASASLGAFDQANELSGDVVIELLTETAMFGNEDRYALKEPIHFDNPNATSVTLRTTQDTQYNPAGEEHFTGTLKRGASGDSMIIAEQGITTENIVLDGGSKAGLTSTASGGIIHANGGTVNVGSGTVLQNSKSPSGNGGAIYAASGVDVNITGSTGGDDPIVLIQNCEAANGGAVYMKDGALSVSGGSEFTACTATTGNGGAVYLKDGTLSVSGGSDFISCAAPKGDGGAVFLTDGTMTMTDGEFQDCRAENGGAVYSASAEQPSETNPYTVQLDGVTINGHTNGSDAAQTNATRGGAIYLSDGMLSLTDSEIDNCSAVNGGAIYSASTASATVNEEKQATVRITDTVIDGHKDGYSADQPNATGSGGAIYLDAGSISLLETEPDKLVITDCSTNDGGKGGAIYLANNTALSMSGGTITDNTSGTSSGAIHPEGGGTRLSFSDDVRISGNTNTDNEGSNVYLGVDSTEVISTDGLGDHALIGVRVADGELFAKLGEDGSRFGTYTGDADDINNANLSHFVNDVTGAIAEKDGADKIKWYSVPVPLIPIYVEKFWANRAPDGIDAIEFKVYGEANGKKYPLPVYDGQDSETANLVTEITKADGWRKQVYVPEYTMSSGVRADFIEGDVYHYSIVEDPADKISWPDPGDGTRWVKETSFVPEQVVPGETVAANQVVTVTQDEYDSYPYTFLCVFNTNRDGRYYPTLKTMQINFKHKTSGMAYTLHLDISPYMLTEATGKYYVYVKSPVAYPANYIIRDSDVIINGKTDLADNVELISRKQLSQLNVYSFVNSIPSMITKVSDVSYELPAKTEPATLRMTNRLERQLTVPLIVQKKWDLPAGKEYGEGKTYDRAPFRIYGVIGTEEIELTAYSVSTAVSGTEVTELRETDRLMVPRDEGSGSEEAAWTRMVYVAREHNDVPFDHYIIKEAGVEALYPNDAWNITFTPSKPQWEEVTNGYTDAYIKVIPTGFAQSKPAQNTNIRRVEFYLWDATKDNYYCTSVDFPASRLLSWATSGEYYYVKIRLPKTLDLSTAGLIYGGYNDDVGKVGVVKEHKPSVLDLGKEPSMKSGVASSLVYGIETWTRDPATNGPDGLPAFKMVGMDTVQTSYDSVEFLSSLPSGAKAENVFSGTEHLYTFPHVQPNARLVMTNQSCVCKIVDKNGVEQGFSSLREALDWARENMKKGGDGDDRNDVIATLELVNDLAMSENDTLTGDYAIKPNEHITIATAKTEAADTANAEKLHYVGVNKDDPDAPHAVITRGFTGDDSLISVNGGELTANSVILDGNKDATDPDTGAPYTCTGNGGLIEVNAGTMHIDSGAVLKNSDATNGGAVYVDDGATVSLTGGTITGNSANGDGAGIYLEEGSRLELSGGFDFGEGNYKNETLTDKTNGGEPYAQPRQDVFLAGYLGKDDGGEPKEAASIVVTGPINAAEPMWVWAEKPDGDEQDNHYEQLKQFAVFDDSLIDEDGKLKLTDEQITSIYQAFRNAQDDETTGSGGEILTGAEGQNGEGVKSICWSGTSVTRKVILRKVGKVYEPVSGLDYDVSLSGAVFNVYRNNGTTPYTVIHKDKTTETLENLESGRNGVFWIGELPKGEYYLHEIAAPEPYESNAGRWFCVIVDETGSYASERGFSDGSEQANRAAALLDATAVRNAALGVT